MVRNRFFSHNIDLIEQARKNFRLQSLDDDTVLAEQSDYVWDPEWSCELFINTPTDISSQAFSTISFNKDYVRVYPLTVDATPLNYYFCFWCAVLHRSIAQDLTSIGYLTENRSPVPLLLLVKYA